MDDLVNTIERLRERISEHRSYFEGGGLPEWRTRIGLIDPLLHTLGWDVTDPATVRIEQRVSASTRSGEGWADYELMRGPREPVMLIEAKKLSERKPARPQVVSYVVNENMSRTYKIPYCAWTNGDDWAVYNVSTQNPLMEVSITEGSTPKIALEFLSLWRVSITGDSFNRAITPIMSEQLVLPPDPTSDPQPDVTPPPPPPPGEWTSLTAEFTASRMPPPAAVRFPDGQEVANRVWYGVLVETALWLNQRGEFGPQSCPIEMGPIRYLFNLDGMHRNGSAFRFLVPIGNTGIKMEAGLSAPHVIQLAQKLLTDFGHNPAQLLLRLQ